MQFEATMIGSMILRNVCGISQSTEMPYAISVIWSA